MYIGTKSIVGLYIGTKAVQKIYCGNQLLCDFSSSSGLTISDNFNSYSVGSLAGQGNWTACVEAMAIVDVSGNKVVKGNTAGNESVCKRSEAFSNDHYAKLTISAIESGGGQRIGVAVRCSGNSAGNCYFYMADGNARIFAYIEGGYYYNIAIEYTGAAVGDVLELRAEGTSIKCYINGSLDSALPSSEDTGVATGTAGSYTSSKFTTGTAGIAGLDAGATYGDLFEAGDI